MMRDIDPASLSSRFSLALTARVEYALMLLLTTAERWDSADLDVHRGNAGNLAWHCGYRYADEPMPSFFEDDEELRDCWTAGVRDKAEEQHRIEVETGIQQKRAKIESLIAAKDWHALRLPDPGGILMALLAGKSCSVAGHYLSPEEELNIVWFTNPYGHDGALANIDELDLACVESFLRDMARGDEYGPVPH